MKKPADMLKLHALGEHSWEEVLTTKERSGGPSPWGNSKYQVFKQCAYLYHLMFVQRYRPRFYDDNLEVGGLFHEILARYFQASMDRGNSCASALVEEIVHFALDIAARAEAVVPGTAAEAARLFRAWLTLNGPGTPKDDREDTAYVEHLLETSQPFAYSARIDRIKWTANGYVIQEHKTARDYDANLLLSYRMEAQFLGQMWLWEQTMERQHGKLAGFEVNLVTKTQMPHCEIVKVPIVPELIRDWEYEMAFVSAHLKRRHKSPRVWPSSRSFRCRYCPAFGHCASGRKSYHEWVKKKPGEY